MGTEKEKTTPVERIPAEWYEPLRNFMIREDASGLTLEMLSHKVSPEELALFKDLWQKSKATEKMDAFELEASPLKISAAEEKKLSRLYYVIATEAENTIKKINPLYLKKP